MSELTDLTGIDLVIGKLSGDFIQMVLAGIKVCICFDLSPVKRMLVFFKIIRIARGGFYFFDDSVIQFAVNAVDAAADDQAKSIGFNRVSHRNLGPVGRGT